MTGFLKSSPSINKEGIDYSIINKKLSGPELEGTTNMEDHLTNFGYLKHISMSREGATIFH